MKIAIDGMGGDHAPKAVVEGVIKSINEYQGIEYYITGPKEQIEEELKNYTYDKSLINIVDAREVISPNEHPVMALKKKKDSSLYKALKLVKDKECDAVISGGSTGAFLAGCTLVVGRIKGIERPALAPIMPGKNGSFMIVDAGANVDCKPNYLVQFAKMGKIYYQGDHALFCVYTYGEKWLYHIFSGSEHCNRQTPYLLPDHRQRACLLSGKM